MERINPRVLLILVVLAGVLPFSNRAVYLDEHIFLSIARNAQTNWLFPSDTPSVFFGTPKANFADHTHPPVGEYYLAVLTAIFGKFREVPFRIAYSLFAIACVLAFYELARRFTAHPLLLSVLFAVSPAFVVYSPTLMMDIPMLAFLLVGMSFYFAGYLIPASLCFVLAAGTGYTALVPLGCLFITLLASGRPLRELAAVAAAPAALAVWIVAMTVHFQDFTLPRTVEWFTSQNSAGHNVLATLSFLGGVCIFPWLIQGERNLMIGSFAAGLLLSLFIQAPAVWYRLWFAALAGFGVLLLLLFFQSARRMVATGTNTGEAVFILWAPATLVFFIAIGDMINARYILLALPALYLVLFRHVTVERLNRLIIPTAILSAVLAFADFKFVNSYRDFVRDRVAPLQQAGFDVWSAAESGPRFYLEQSGAETLSTGDLRPKPVDLIVRSAGRYQYGLSEQLEVVLTKLKAFDLEYSFPVRTFNDKAGAGFHDSRLGLVPFTFSRAPFDTLMIAQVSPLPGAAYGPTGPVFTQTEPEVVFPMKFPSNTTIEYEREGEGEAEVTPEGIRLKRGREPVTIWRNFRVVPKQFATQ